MFGGRLHDRHSVEVARWLVHFLAERARAPVAILTSAAPLVDMFIALAILLSAGGFALSEPLSAALQRRNTPFGVYAGGYASDYEPVFATVPLVHYLPPPRPQAPARPLRQAYSHMRQQIYSYAASAPQVRYGRHYPGATIHHPPPAAYSTQAAAPTAAYPTSAAYTASPWPPAGADILYVTEAAEEEPVYLTEASDAVVLDAAEVYDHVMYARPDHRGGYSYRRRPARRPRPAAPRPSPSSEPYILKIKKRKIYYD